MARILMTYDATDSDAETASNPDFEVIETPPWEDTHRRVRDDLRTMFLDDVILDSGGRRAIDSLFEGDQPPRYPCCISRVHHPKRPHVCDNLKRWQNRYGEELRLLHNRHFAWASVPFEKFVRAAYFASSSSKADRSERPEWC